MEDNGGALSETEAEAPVAATEVEAAVMAVSDTDVVKVTEADGTETGFASLQEAFDYIDGYTDGKGFTVADGEVGGTYTITLLADCSNATMSAKNYLGKALNVTLDLNGHTVTGTSSASVLNITIGTAAYPSVFTIKDSSGNNSGKITGGKWGVLFAGALATLNFEGGTITNNHGGTTGGGICANGTSNQPVINLNGGVITGNSVTGTSSPNSGFGGGVYACQINVNGTVITGNYAYGGSHKQTGRGGGICTPITGTAKYNVVKINTNTVYGNFADNAGDDLMIQKNGMSSTKHTLVIGTENWYIDGWNGIKATVGNGETDRYSAENPVPYTDGGFEQQYKIHLGLKYVAPAPTYTVTYTDGVEGEEVFADQVYSVEENSATPAFDGTPARVGFTFTGWDPQVAETVTADATYTAVWAECQHQWGESTFDEETLSYVKTCTICGLTESTPVVAKLESTGVYYQTLQEALDAARALIVDADNAVQTVTLVADTTECVTLSWVPSRTTAHNFNLTIDLNGHTVTGTGSDSVMKFMRAGSWAAKYSMNITINDSSEAKTGTVTGGNASSGGAIYTKGMKSIDSLTINGGNFVNNTASSTGGAIYSAVVGYDVVINGGTFTGNTAKSGGAISAYTLTINGGTITGNSATGDSTFTGRGGAISMWGTVALNLDINGGQIYGNTASRYGDDIVFCSTNKTNASMTLMDAADMGVSSVSGWYVDGYFGAYGSEANLTDRYGAVYNEFTDYADFSKAEAKGIAVALKAALGEAPEAPDKYGKNVTSSLIRVICDTEEDHAPMDIAWQFQSTGVYPKGSEPVWDSELGAWTIGVRIDSISTYYVWQRFEKAYNDIYHDLVPDAPIPEGKYNIDTTLKWDETQQLWTTLDGKPIEVHVSCKTEPTAPAYNQMRSYQIQVMGDLDGDGIYGEKGTTNESGIYELYTTSIPEEYYKDIVVKGSREEGFTVDITIPLADGDIFITNWIEKRAPGEEYFYNWDKTPESITFTLKYTGDLDGNLNGAGVGDWVLSTTGKYYGVVGTAYVGKEVTVTYTDGVENAEIFADQVYTVVDGSNTPAYEGTPERDGYDFAGWTPEVAETVDGDTVYTATWTPRMPVQSNVTDELVAIICDSDPDRHATVYGKWYPQHCSVLSDAEIVWNEELDTWTVDVKIGSLYIMYVDQLEDANYGTIHELVEDITTVYATLKWDAEQALWIPAEPIELHTTCQTAPTAPTHNQLSAYQIKVHGLVDGEEKDWTTSIPEGSYVVGEVKGSREEGFTVDVTVTIKDGDTFITNWIAQRNPGVDYVYNWDKTAETVTFTLKYNGSLTGTLHGDRHASNTNYDWILSTTGKTWGVVGDAYVGQEATVTYTDGVNEIVIFQDQITDTFIGEATPAFEGELIRENYTFKGWTPEIVESVEGTVTYTAVWEPVPYTVSFYPLGSAESSEELKVSYGTSLEDSETELPALNEKNAGTLTGHTAAYWYYVDEKGNEVVFDETTVVEGDLKVYPKFLANTYTVTLDAGKGKLETETVEVTYGSLVGKLPVPTREGYTFEGWLDADGKLVTEETVYTTDSDTVYTASWKAVETKPSDPTSPGTGDGFMITVAVFTMIICAAGLVFTLVNRKKFFRK